MQIDQRDREADFETLIASAYSTGYHDGGIDTLEDGHHPDSAAEGLAQWKADNAGLIEGHRTADTARIAELEAENFRLAAGACINPGEHGLVGDEHGNSYCTAFRALTDEQREHSEALALVNERDARIAELEEVLQRISKLEGIGGPDAELQCADIARTALGGQP